MKKKIVLLTKVPAIWQIGILFPDGKKISKPKCSLNEIFNTYRRIMEDVILNLSEDIREYQRKSFNRRKNRNSK